MDWHTLWQAALLGIVEGLTEFIPVSSTGHLILLIDLLGFQGPPGKLFEVVIQLGAILAVCWVYRARLLGLLFHPIARESLEFERNILLAFIPAALLGALFHDVIKQVLFSPLVVSVALITGGIAILLVERYKPAHATTQMEDLTHAQALKIGLFQCLALVPGVSRAGATILGALLVKVDRKTATEFSFFLAIPVMFGAVTLDLYKNWASLTADGAGIIAVGFVSAFLCALLVVKMVVGFVARHGFVPFAYYRIALGSIMLWILLA